MTAWESDSLEQYHVYDEADYVVSVSESEPPVAHAGAHGPMEIRSRPSLIVLAAVGAVGAVLALEVLARSSRPIDPRADVPRARKGRVTTGLRPSTQATPRVITAGRPADHPRARGGVRERVPGAQVPLAEGSRRSDEPSQQRVVEFGFER